MDKWIQGYYELQIRNEVLSDSHITAVGEFYLNGISPKLYYLEGLNLQHNQIACEKYKNYHICNNLELLSGGYQLAQIMGWIDAFQNKIWSYEGIYEIRSQNQNENQNQNLSGLALCCLDLNQN
ncbi:hypothetical protein PPERSA_13093 [Pseudocohnilembus persalinus]|uniref:DUF8019 domain-containing protein n=1 Tax=Pseudocohnilembus persalinus TaxID=266149 RepID=A0A0V0QWN1_PSEPJ|nr:hypothetical protein PPERSA_13093 [Pseudocohnilembus persalinus]|eukprot:KRX06614.1 hypothetical protein PPERSA_13093 [Pseudocohnilembus persalinus]